MLCDIAVYDDEIGIYINIDSLVNISYRNGVLCGPLLFRWTCRWRPKLEVYGATSFHADPLSSTHITATARLRCGHHVPPERCASGRGTFSAGKMMLTQDKYQVPAPPHPR